MVQLDHMTMGRTMFGVGPGALPSDAMQMGIDPRETRRRMDEALEVIMRLLAGERVTAETDWFRLHDARLQHGCYSRPRMEMAVTTIRSPSGAVAAGRHGIGLLSLGGTSDDALAAYAKNWTVCEDTARAHGQSVDRRHFRVAIQMHLAETRAQAREDVRYGLDAYARYTQDVLPFGPIPPGVTDVFEFVVENKRGIIGTPDDAIRHIEHAQAGSGGFGVVLLMAHDWADPAATLKSYELFARRVMPHFHRQFDARRASYDFAKDNHQRFFEAAKQGLDDANRQFDERQKD
jgi:limonene 1,2-monooxygenase